MSNTNTNTNTTIALGMIVYNEINETKAILDEIGNFFDEILIIVDNPTDETFLAFNELSKIYSCRIFSSTGLEYTRRNIYLNETKCDWIFTIDTDEKISLENLYKLKDFITTLDQNVGAIRLPIINYFGRGRWSTTFFPKVIRCKINLEYSQHIHHTSVASSVYKNEMVFERSPYFIEHFGPLLGKNEYTKRLKRIKDMESKLNMIEPNSFFYSMIAVEYISLGDLENGLKYINTAINASGDKDFANFLKALINYRLNLTWIAKEELEQVSLQKSFCGEAAQLLADIDAREGNITSALQRIRPYVIKHNDNPSLLLNYASLLVEYDPKKAIEYGLKSLNIMPSLSNPLIYGSGAIYNPYSFQDTFVQAYDNIYSILSRAYMKVGNLNEYRYWNEKFSLLYKNNS